MVVLIIGGSASGKSAYGEQVIGQLSQHPVYLATMDSRGTAAQKRIEKHRAMRAGKGFRTLECKDATSILAADMRGQSVLLEDLPNLVANVMFQEVNGSVAEAKQQVRRALFYLEKETTNLVIITGDLASEGLLYDEVTTAYLRLLGELQQEIAADAEEVYEVVAGIPMVLKGVKE
jgi:adenosylcobinamide kinase/adenosylcobinamide-phosphate guanylyltransferase